MEKLIQRTTSSQKDGKWIAYGLERSSDALCRSFFVRGISASDGILNLKEEKNRGNIVKQRV